MPLHCFETEMTFFGKLKCKIKTHQNKNDPPVAPRTIEKNTKKNRKNRVYFSKNAQLKNLFGTR